MDEIRVSTQFGDLVAVPYEGQDDKGVYDGIQIYLEDPAFPHGRSCCVVVEEFGKILRYDHDQNDEVLFDEPYVLAE